MNFYLAMTIASLKMYSREPVAIFWTFFFPAVLMAIFGFINFGAPPEPVKLGLVDQANNGASTGFGQALRAFSGDDSFTTWDVLSYETEAEGREAIEQSSELDALLIVPQGFGNSSETVIVELVVDRGDLINSQIAEAGVNGALDEFFITFANVPQDFRRTSAFNLSISNTVPEAETADGDPEFSFTELLVPGIAAMAIMQTGVFGSVFTLIRFKSQGILRRMRATPSGPLPLLVGRSTSQISVIVVQTYILLALGVVLFGITISPGGGVLSWISTGIVTLLGGFTFLGLGLVLSGRLNSENVAAPLANIITLPMLFLSGVFFPREFLPEWMAIVSSYFPLTFLVEALRTTVITGGTVVDVWQEIVGLVVWILVVFGVGVRIFRWE